MSQGTACKCGSKRWAVYQRRCNFSAFSGYHFTPSAYSGVFCLDCRAVWRTRAAYVDRLPSVPLSALDWDRSAQDAGYRAGQLARGLA